MADPQGHEPKEPQRLDRQQLRRAIRHATGSTDVMIDVVAAWARIVGPHLAAHTRPTRCVGATLVVDADSTAAAAGLRLRHTTITNHCYAAFDLIIDRIQVRVVANTVLGDQ